ncbi:MAG: MscS family membrane protein [Halioglobus sp.]|jgi:MscS family membrane protein
MTINIFAKFDRSRNGSRVIPAFLLALITSLLPALVYSEETAEVAAQLNDVKPIGEIDQSTPLKTAQGFMRFSELGEFESASDYLDLRYLPKVMSETDGATLAEQLYIVISRKLPIEFDALSDVTGGMKGDGLPSYRDTLGTLATTQGKLAIYLQQIPGEGDTRIWRVSNASVARIPQLYELFGYSPYVELIRAQVPEGSFLGAESFKWVIGLIAGIGSAIAWLIIAWPLSLFLTRRNSANTGLVKQYLTRPIPTLIFVLVGATTLKILGLGVTASSIVEGGTLVTIAVVWFLFATINLLRDLYAQFLDSRGRASALMLLSPVTKTIKVVIVLLATVVWLDNIGVNVTALVAGLGVGGLAVALVLQKPLEDIMGAITLYAMQPVTVGQLCTCGEVTGTIEVISLRTTRLRTLKNTVFIVPNAIFATASIENISERNRILHRQTVRLALDTPESVVSNTIEKLREMLLTIDEVTEDASRVRLVGFGEFSLNVEIFAHVGTTQWTEFLAIAEVINLKTLSALEGTGAKLAEPPR